MLTISVQRKKKVWGNTTISLTSAEILSMGLKESSFPEGIIAKIEHCIIKLPLLSFLLSFCCYKAMFLKN